MANTITANTAAADTLPATGGSSSAASPSAGNQEVSKDLFLKLMVAQLKHQNPLSPVDGVDFLMQLSQISGVEQMVEMRQQLTSIRDLLAGAAAPVPAAGDTTST